MKKSLILLLLCTFGFSVFRQPAQAQSEEADSAASSSSTVIQITREEASPNATDHERAGAMAILRNLERLAGDSEQKERLGSAYEEVAEKNRGFIARVVGVKDQSIRVSTSKGEIFLVPDKSTTLVKKSETVTADMVTLAEWFEIDDWLVVIGVENGETFAPRRIVSSPESLEAPEQFMQRFNVKTVQKTKLEAIPSGETAAQNLLITAKTVFQNADGSELDLSDLPKETLVVAMGTVNANGNKTVGVVRALVNIE